MMVHVVVFRPRPEYDEAGVRAVLRTLQQEMSTAYPGISSVTGGHTFTDRGAGYTHATVWRWRDRASWEKQVGDETHVAIARRHFAPMREAFLALDFEPVT